MIEKIFKSIGKRYDTDKNKTAHNSNDNETMVSMVNKTKEYNQINKI